PLRAVVASSSYLLTLRDWLELVVPGAHFARSAGRESQGPVDPLFRGPRPPGPLDDRAEAAASGSCLASADHENFAVAVTTSAAPSRGPGPSWCPGSARCRGHRARSTAGGDPRHAAGWIEAREPRAHGRVRLLPSAVAPGTRSSTRTL